MCGNDMESTRTNTYIQYSLLKKYGIDYEWCLRKNIELQLH